MTTTEFEAFIKAHAKQGIGNRAYNFIGLAGETGEVLEWFKKAVYRKNPKYTKQLLLSELGDVLHYLTRIGLCYRMSLDEIMEFNKQKIEERHGTKNDKRLHRRTVGRTKRQGSRG